MARASKSQSHATERTITIAEKRIRSAVKKGETDLDLSGLGLTTLPKSFGDIAKNLEHLDISRNKFEQLPECLRESTLRELEIQHNDRLMLPDWPLGLERLAYLDAEGCLIPELPRWIGQLASLEVLDVSSAGLREIPDWIGALDHLEMLLLDRNFLTTLPTSIGGLERLQMLDLNTNRLIALPESMRQLKALQKLFLYGNPSLGLPQEIEFETNPVHILDYYLRLRLGKRPLNEAKLILLGRGEVGKTSLVDRLVRNRFSPTQMTRGIAITDWVVDNTRGPIRMHVWDFGGQEIQHSTHQFFLTERSLYLVVLNGRSGGEDEDAEYWLKFVKTFGASSTTIVVLNKFKMQPFQVNRRALQEKYPFIRAFVETDCKPSTKNGIPELRREIESALSDMDHVRADFPTGWFEIKERLARMKEPFLSFAEYRKICVRLGESDPKAQELLASHLNALGIALNYREDPQLRDETVLNPHWITDGVYRIITANALADRKGELRLSDLAAVLPKKKYPAKMHAFLIGLMRKFELCFPYQDDGKESRFLVPELLDKEQPALEDPFPPADCLNFRYDYRLMPEGLLPRFITRTHTMSRPQERWRTGVVLRWEGCRALVRADKQDRQVLVRVLGEPDKRRRLLAVVRENFDQIHSEMSEFKPTEWVALEEHPDEWVSYRELEVFDQRRETELRKPVGDDIVSVDVTKVLSDTDVVRAREKRDARTGIDRPLKLFISYAHEDERWRESLAPNLGLLQREGLIVVWCDLQIRAGDKWDDEIKRKLEDADLYLFLMSTDLLNSDYVQSTELPIARRRHDQGEARLIPVVVRTCSWQRVLGNIQALPTGGAPVKQWRDRDDAYFNIEEGLREAIAAMRKR